MHRIDTPTAQTDKFGAGKNGFTRGNPQTGVPATALDDDYFDAIQEELAGIVEAAGIVLDKSNRAQVLAAIQHLITAGIPDIKDASLTQKGIVQLSSSITSTSEALAATPRSVKTVNDAAAQRSANLSDVASVPIARTNLGLLAAALLDVATNAEVAAGIANKVVTVPGLISLFSKRSFSVNDYIRIPDVPGGLIIQWAQAGAIPSLAASTGINKPVTFPILFPNNYLAYWGTISGSATNTYGVTISCADLTTSGMSLNVYNTGIAAKTITNVLAFVIGF